MGLSYQQKQAPDPKFQPKLDYIARMDMDIAQKRLLHLVLSPTNSNLLIVSGS
jgi:hypothetical protein